VFGLSGCEPRGDGQVEQPAPDEQPTPTEPPAPTKLPAPTDADEPEPAAEYRAKVILVPLRDFPEDLTLAVEDALRAELEVEVVRHEVVELPKQAFYEPRRRYRADELLDFLERFADEAEAAEPGAEIKVLGMTEVDISTTKEPHEDWGIFGLGRSPGRTAVISSKRLKRRPKNREHVRFRVATTAVHEIGHTFGLPHCAEKQARCVMLDAEGGIENTDSSTGKLGPACAAKLTALAGT
jgi:archaemetzincin